MTNYDVPRAHAEVLSREALSRDASAPFGYAVVDDHGCREVYTGGGTTPESLALVDARDYGGCVVSLYEHLAPPLPVPIAEILALVEAYEAATSALALGGSLARPSTRSAHAAAKSALLAAFAPPLPAPIVDVVAVAREVVRLAGAHDHADDALSVFEGCDWDDPILDGAAKALMVAQIAKRDLDEKSRTAAPALAAFILAWAPVEAALSEWAEAKRTEVACCDRVASMFDSRESNWKAYSAAQRDYSSARERCDDFGRTLIAAVAGTVAT